MSSKAMRSYRCSDAELSIAASSFTHGVSFSSARTTKRFPSHVIRVYDAAGNLIETHEHKGDFKEW
jgi:hypothetical protein